MKEAGLASGFVKQEDKLTTLKLRWHQISTSKLLPDTTPTRTKLFYSIHLYLHRYIRAHSRFEQFLNNPLVCNRNVDLLANWNIGRIVFHSCSGCARQVESLLVFNTCKHFTMGSRASTLLREEEIEEIKKETGCKLSSCDVDGNIKYLLKFL